MAATMRARRVLLIEDEPGLVLTLTDRLKSEGYEVGTAADGPSGLERATRESWDVILLDVMLPGANGFDVCRDLRQRSITTPIIMLTARGQIVDKVLGLKLGADDYLTKPFDMLELMARSISLRARTRCSWIWTCCSTRLRSVISRTSTETLRVVLSGLRIGLNRAINQR